MPKIPNFTFKPLPAISSASSGNFTVSNDLGSLRALAGTWKGTGFNVIWRPNSVPGQDRFLELNVTSEELVFSEIDGPIPNRGFLQGDMEMRGLTYLQKIDENTMFKIKNIVLEKFKTKKEREEAENELKLAHKIIAERKFTNKQNKVIDLLKDLSKYSIDIERKDDDYPNMYI